MRFRKLHEIQLVLDHPLGPLVDFSLSACNCGQFGSPIGRLGRLWFNPQPRGIPLPVVFHLYAYKHGPTGLQFGVRFGFFLSACNLGPRGLLFGRLGRLGFSPQPRDTRPIPGEFSYFVCNLGELLFGRLGRLGFSPQPRDTYLGPVPVEFSLPVFNLCGLPFGRLGRLGFSLQPRETYLRPFPVEISLFSLCGLPFGRLGHLGFNLQPRDTHLSPVLAERWAVLYKIVYPVLQELFEFAWKPVKVFAALGC